MIHPVELPDLTRKRLTDLVMLQLRLLKYAANTKTLKETDCAKFLNKSRRFRGRGAGIAKWLWRGPLRLRLLREFAAGATSTAKLQWVQELSSDVIKLLRREPDGDLHAQNCTVAPVWQQRGDDFLQKFYSDWYERGFPECFFSEVIEGPFTRHDFLEAFRNTNYSLYVCAACDDARAISGQEGDLKSSIDHYLPKELYPHLILHPFNLVPGCQLCNSAKKTNDITGRPGSRRDLGKIILPYREAGLRESTYLQAKFKGATLFVQFGQLKPLRGFDVQSRIEAFSDVFNIPARWTGSVDHIGETLFRTMKQFRGANSKAVKAPAGLLAFMEDMLNAFGHENLGKDPHVFAMMCWLEKILRNAVRPVVKGTARPLAEKRLQAIQQQLKVKLTSGK
jgi:hypothetical protein